MPIDAPPKGKGTIGGLKKEYVYIGGGIAVIVVGVVYYRSKKQASTTNTTGTVTDPAGNVCAALSPSSGYCPGTPEDLAYAGNTATGSGGLVGQNSASYVGGQIVGYDQYGNPIYSSNSGVSNTGPGNFTNNAAWAQAAQTYLVDSEPNADPGVIGSALGAYVNGQGVTAAQRSIIEQAIAFEGMPPVGGTNGDPPGIKDIPVTGGGGGGGTGGGTTKVKVPNVVKKTVNAAHTSLQSAGLTFNEDTAKDKPGYDRIVTTQRPASGVSVDKGSRVSLSWTFVKDKK